MMEFVQVTAQYSNAVLVAVLPYISDFAHKLDLPMTIPVMPGQVREFTCDPRKGETGGLVILTNGFRFSFIEGHVSSYRSAKSYFSLQDPDLIPTFYGTVRVKEKEALKIAKGVIKRLGYTDGQFHPELAPRVTEPEKIGTNHVARYRFRWLDPDWRGPKISGIAPVLLDVEVDASNGQIQLVSLGGSNLRQASPKVDVSPPLLPASQPSQKGLSGGKKTDPLNPEYSSAFLNGILPQLSDFSAKAALPLQLPLTTNDVDLSRYHCRLLDGQPMAQLFLKNGDRFNYEHGRVVAYYAYDAYHKFPDQGRLSDFIGKLNMSTNEAIALCERIIKSLGYKTKLPKAMIGNVTRLGTQDVARYVFYWWKPKEQLNFATIEVDMENKTLKSVYLDDPSLWRNPPKIEVPMMVETNTAPEVTHQ